MNVTGLKLWKVKIDSGNGLVPSGYYLRQCWPRSLSPYGVNRPQWVKYHNHILVLSGCGLFPDVLQEIPNSSFNKGTCIVMSGNTMQSISQFNWQYIYSIHVYFVILGRGIPIMKLKQQCGCFIFALDIPLLARYLYGTSALWFISNIFLEMQNN